jgi:acyl carrier protein
MRPSSRNDVFNKVVLAVEQTVHITNHGLTPATRLADDLGVGRFGRIRLAVYLEETFDIEITDEAIDQFATVADIVKYVSRRTHEDPRARSP